MTPIDEESLKRTEYGIVSSFEELFSKPRIAKVKFSNRHQGTAYDYEFPEVFLSTLYAPSLGICSVPLKGILVVSPSAKLREEFGDISFTLEIAERREQGHYLVLAKYVRYVGSVWLGFVPIGQTFEVMA